jgi:hypothetical protein
VRSVPDYISPITSYRVWRWDVAGLPSLNGELWQPGKPLEAGCRVADLALLRGRANAAHSPHDAPQINCTCGIYASKSLEHLRECGYERSGIHGQVSLWGTVVEHQHGWRAQYAYPKSFFLLPEILPLTLMEIQSRLLALTSYRCDIFIIHDSASLPLWKENSGLAAAGLDFLMSRGSKWYAQRNQESTIKQGDRVAIVGRGTAVVKEIDSTWIQAVLGNKAIVRIARQRVSWNRQNVRWETSTHALYEANEKS